MTRQRDKTACRRRGFTYLELQVSFALFAIALSGLLPLSVMQSRQITRGGSLFEPDQTHYITPSNRSWARKLGAAAFVTPAPLDLPNPPPDEPMKPVMIDDGDPGYVELNKGSDDWTQQAYAQAYQADYRLNYPDAKGDQVKWVFTGLPQAQYSVYVSFRALSYAATDAEYRIYEDGQLLRKKKVDQTEEPDDKDASGVRWKKIGVVKFFGSELSVELDDKPADGYLVIDAVRVVPKGTDMQLLAVARSYSQGFVEARVQLPKKPGGKGGKGGKGGGKGGK